MKALIDCGSMGNYITDSLVPAVGMEVILEKDFELLEWQTKQPSRRRAMYPFAGQQEIQLQGYCLGVSQLEIGVILGTPWLIKENPNIDWVKTEVKLRHRGQLQVVPL